MLRAYISSLARRVHCFQGYSLQARLLMRNESFAVYEMAIKEREGIYHRFFWGAALV